MSKPSPQHPVLAANPTLSEREAFEAWQAHVDAGRIGRRAVPDPARPGRRSSRGAGGVPAPTRTHKGPAPA